MNDDESSAPVHQRGRNMSLKQRAKGIGLSSDRRLKEEAKSEGNHSDDEDYEANVLHAIEGGEDATSNLSSLPSETDEESVVAVIKSKDVRTNQLTLVAMCPKQVWNTQKVCNDPKPVLENIDSNGDTNFRKNEL